MGSLIFLRCHNIRCVTYYAGRKYWHCIKNTNIIKDYLACNSTENCNIWQKFKRLASNVWYKYFDFFWQYFIPFLRSACPHVRDASEEVLDILKNFTVYSHLQSNSSPSISYRFTWDICFVTEMFVRQRSLHQCFSTFFVTVHP